jgi:colicin import membrane protein
MSRPWCASIVATCIAVTVALPAASQDAAHAPPDASRTATTTARTQTTAPAPAGAATTNPRPTTSAPALTVPPPANAKPNDAAANAKAQADKEKQELAAAMDRVAERWRRRAAAQGWTMHPPTPVASAAGFDASAQQSSASGQPGGRLGSAARDAPVRSEKRGTAPPSSDVKQKTSEAAKNPPPVR